MISSSTDSRAEFTNPFNDKERIEVRGVTSSDKNNNSESNDTAISTPAQNQSNRKHSTLHTSKGLEIETPENEALKEGESEPEPDVVETGPAKKGGGPRKGSLAGEKPDNKNPWSEGAF